MRLKLLLPALLLPGILSAQAFVRVGGGMTASSEFLKDFIVEPLGARQSASPTAVVVAGWQFANGYRLGVEGRYAIGQWQVEDRGETDDVAELRTLGLGVYADGPIRGDFRWEAVAGKLSYEPEREIGPFSSGAPSPWMVGGGVSWVRPISPRFGFVVSARYDFHSFNTDRLDAENYSSRQAVHRGSLTIAIERGF
jgi:hypothetical protein